MITKIKQKNVLKAIFNVSGGGLYSVFPAIFIFFGLLSRRIEDKYLENNIKPFLRFESRELFLIFEEIILFLAQNKIGFSVYYESETMSEAFNRNLTWGYCLAIADKILKQ